MGKVYYAFSGIIIQLALALIFVFLNTKKAGVEMSGNDFLIFSVYSFTVFAFLRLILTVPLTWLGKLVGDKLARFFGIMSELFLLVFTLLDGLAYYLKGFHLIDSQLFNYLIQLEFIKEYQLSYLHYSIAALAVLFTIFIQWSIQHFFCFRVHWENAFAIGLAFLIVTNAVIVGGTIYSMKDYLGINKEKIVFFPLLPIIVDIKKTP